MAELGFGDGRAVLEKSGDYAVFRRDNVTFVYYIDDIWKFGEVGSGSPAMEIYERGPKADGSFNGDLQFWFWPIGTGKDATLRLYNEDGVNIGQYGSYQSCDSGPCTIRTELMYTNRNGTNVIKPVDSQPGSEAIEDDRYLLMGLGETDMPEGWPEAVKTEGDYTATVTSSLANNYCNGDSASVGIELTNERLAGSAEVSVTTINHTTGNSNTSNVTIPEGGTSITREVNVSGNSQQNADVMTVEINGNGVYTGSANIGVVGGDIGLTVTSIDSSVIEGQEYSGDVEVSNSGNCSADVTVSYETKQ